MHRLGRIVIAPLIAIALLIPTAPGVTLTHAAAAQTYLVVYSQQVSSSDAANGIAQAGGTLVYNYDAIGVAVARSDSPSFGTDVLQDSRVEAVSSTAGFATQLHNTMAGTDDAQGPPAGDLPNAPASDTDVLSPLQWDMRQIHTPEAHAITGGSPAVVAGDIDTGMDYNHPDLKQNVDFADSVSCIGGVPNQSPSAWLDDNGHGTHTAGTIAAAQNGIGIVGVAPNVRIAAIKAGDAAGYFFPEAVVCAFVWAGSHHIDVTNNSYFADPFEFNCRNDPVQRAIWIAEKRAIRYAMTQGTTVVAAAGNDSTDLSHPEVDVVSPDFPPGAAVTREITNACVVIPVEIPGVIGVSADGNMLQNPSDPNSGYLKSFYSNYGVSAIEVVAPGGDSVFGRTPQAPNGRVLSTWPAYIPCSRSVKEPVSDPNEPTAVYCYLQGTSMASPHVAGIAALIISRFGSASNPQNGKLRPGQVAALIQQTADPQPCPSTLPGASSNPFGLAYSAFTQNSGEPQTCQGGPGHNSWYGNGQTNAFNAVTHAPGK